MKASFSFSVRSLSLSTGLDEVLTSLFAAVPMPQTLATAPQTAFTGINTMTPPEPIKPKPDTYDEAHAANEKAKEQLNQKIEQCLHAGGLWPTEADYKVWIDAADALRKVGQAPQEAVE